MSKLNGHEQPFNELKKKITARRAAGTAPDRLFETADHILLAEIAEHDLATVTQLADELVTETGTKFFGIYLLDCVRLEMADDSSARPALVQAIEELRKGSDRMRFRMAHAGQLKLPAHQDDDAA